MVSTLGFLVWWLAPSLPGVTLGPTAIDLPGLGSHVVAVDLGPAAFFGVLLAIEMVVAIASLLPVSNIAEHTGLKPVVALGFAVYAVFPSLLISAPANAGVLVALFAFSGLRFAGLPSHKALIVGPAERNAGGRVTGTYSLDRNAFVVPSAAIGGWLYGAEVIAIGGVVYFVIFGKRFEAYAKPS